MTHLFRTNRFKDWGELNENCYFLFKTCMFANFYIKIYFLQTLKRLNNDLTEFTKLQLPKFNNLLLKCT